MLKTIRAVLSGFLGIRSKDGYHSDFEQLSLPKIIAVGIVGTIIFILTLVLIVGYVTR